MFQKKWENTRIEGQDQDPSRNTNPADQTETDGVEAIVEKGEEVMIADPSRNTNPAGQSETDGVKAIVEKGEEVMITDPSINTNPAGQTETVGVKAIVEKGEEEIIAGIKSTGPENTVMIAPGRVQLAGTMKMW